MNQRGFTLIEILIAIGIFAIIGLTAYRVLDTVSDTQQIMDVRTASLRQLQKTASIIKKDFLQMVDRPIRSEYDEVIPALTTKGQYPIEFSHSGWRNPAGMSRAQVQRVAYQVKEHQLLRYYWNVLDRAQDTKPIKQVLLNDVESIDFRFLNTKKEWQDSWPANSSVSRGNEHKTALIPMAIEVLLKTTHDGDIRWLFLMGDIEREDDQKNP